MSILQIQSTFSMKQYFDVFILIFPVWKNKKESIAIIAAECQSVPINHGNGGKLWLDFFTFLHCKCSNSVLITIYRVHYY